ncbi:hypothetical protein [Dactylosporangium sp. CA-139066]|uniref:hypothetical protein n=1 Tax=Dactylosporangium sp. CA-139066 TaxID=3239930 RepID=UPI003D8D7A54
MNAIGEVRDEPGRLDAGAAQLAHHVVEPAPVPRHERGAEPFPPEPPRRGQPERRPRTEDRDRAHASSRKLRVILNLASVPVPGHMLGA